MRIATDADFAMIKNNYNAAFIALLFYSHLLFLQSLIIAQMSVREGSNVGYKKNFETFSYPAMMPEGTKMVPRVFYNSIGVIFGLPILLLSIPVNLPLETFVN